MGYLNDHKDEFCVNDCGIFRKPNQLELGEESVRDLTHYIDLRSDISSLIYQIANQQTEQLRGNYSVTEAVRWTEDREAIALGNYAHFDARAGSLTGRVYAETRVIPKIAAGNIFLDKVIAKRTNLILALDSVLDEDLDSFDYISGWDEESDYVPPPIEEVSTSAWRTFMDNISWNYKF